MAGRGVPQATADREREREREQEQEHDGDEQQRVQLGRDVRLCRVRDDRRAHVAGHGNDAAGQRDDGRLGLSDHAGELPPAAAFYLLQGGRAGAGDELEGELCVLDS